MLIMCYRITTKLVSKNAENKNERELKRDLLIRISAYNKLPIYMREREVNNRVIGNDIYYENYNIDVKGVIALIV